MENLPPTKRLRFFYGYWVAASAFVLIFVSGGIGFYVFSLFVRPLQAEFGWGRGEIMIGLTTFFLIGGIAAPYIGRVIDHYGARMVTFGGALTLGLGLVFLSLMQNIWHYYVSYIIIAIGWVAMGPVPATTLVSNWFEKRRGTALGIMSTGMGAGGLVLSPLMGYFISSFGWRESYLALAIFTWVTIIPLALFVIRTKPSDMNLEPYGAEVAEINIIDQALPIAEQGLTLKQALSTPALWMIGLAFLMGSFAGNGTIQNQVPHLEDIGFPLTTAAAALGAVGLGSVIGKLFFGWLCDKIPAKLAWAIALGLGLTGIIILVNINAESPPAMLWLYAIVIGVGLGGYLPIASMLVSSHFGLVSYGAIFGMVSFLQSIGISTGPLVAGYMYDAMDTYHWALIIFAAVCATGISIILMVRRPKLP